MVNVTTTCPVCNKEFVFEMTEVQFQELEKGEKHIQDILPDFKAEDREMFISGYCPKCWDDIFADDEEGGAA